MRIEKEKEASKPGDWPHRMEHRTGGELNTECMSSNLTKPTWISYECEVFSLSLALSLSIPTACFYIHTRTQTLSVCSTGQCSHSRTHTTRPMYTGTIGHILFIRTWGWNTVSVELSLQFFYTVRNPIEKLVESLSCTQTSSTQEPILTKWFHNFLHFTLSDFTLFFRFCTSLLCFEWLLLFVLLLTIQCFISIVWISYSFAYWFFFSLLLGVARFGFIVGQSFFNFDFFLFTEQNKKHQKKESLAVCECVKLMQNTRTHGRTHDSSNRFQSVLNNGIKISAAMSNHPKNRKRLLLLSLVSFQFFVFFFSMKKQKLTETIHIFKLNSYLFVIFLVPTVG